MILHSFISELKQKDVQSILSWTLEDAIANYDACKITIEQAATNDDITKHAEASSLKYIMDVYRYCVNLATAKQVSSAFPRFH